MLAMASAAYLLAFPFRSAVLTILDEAIPISPLLLFVIAAELVLVLCLLASVHYGRVLITCWVEQTKARSAK
jgi:hypothetical protein